MPTFSILTLKGISWSQPSIFKGTIRFLMHNANKRVQKISRISALGGPADRGNHLAKIPTFLGADFEGFHAEELTFTV